MSKLLVNPTIASYSVRFGQNVIATRLEGGAARYRLDKIGSTHEVAVQWMLEAQAYDYLMAFYRTEMDYGSLPFTIALKSVDSAALVEHTARLVPGTLSVTAFLGNVYQVSATLEVTPAAVVDATDQATVATGPGL